MQQGKALNMQKIATKREGYAVFTLKLRQTAHV